MASLLKGYYQKKKGNPQISQRADKKIQEVIEGEKQKRKSSLSFSPFDPKFQLQPRVYGDDVSKATLRGFDYKKLTQAGKNKSKKQLIAEIRKEEGRSDTADEIALKEELEKNRKRRASQEKRDGHRENLSRRVSKVAAWKKAKEDEAKKVKKEKMEDIIKNVKNTRITPFKQGRSRIPTLSPEMRLQFEQEHLDHQKEIEKSKEERRRRKKEEEEEEKMRKKQNERLERRKKVVSDFKARKGELVQERIKKLEEASLKEARDSRSWTSKKDLESLSEEDKKELARGRIRSNPPPKRTPPPRKSSKTKKAGKKKRRRKTRKKRRRRTKKKKRKRRRRTKKRRRK